MLILTSFCLSEGKGVGDKAFSEPNAINDIHSF